MAKLRLKFIELASNNPKKVKPGHCKGCGAKLTDELSVKRGYGPKCFSKHFAIVLESVE